MKGVNGFGAGGENISQKVPAMGRIPVVMQEEQAAVVEEVVTGERKSVLIQAPAISWILEQGGRREMSLNRASLQSLRSEISLASRISLWDSALLSSGITLGSGGSFGVGVSLGRRISLEFTMFQALKFLTKLICLRLMFLLSRFAVQYSRLCSCSKHHQQTLIWFRVCHVGWHATYST